MFYHWVVKLEKELGIVTPFSDGCRLYPEESFQALREFFTLDTQDKKSIFQEAKSRYLMGFCALSDAFIESLRCKYGVRINVSRLSRMFRKNSLQKSRRLDIIKTNFDVKNDLTLNKKRTIAVTLT